MAALNQLSSILELGLIYAIIALGVYITYKILDIPDLSVDGTFPLGGAVFAVLLTAGVPFWAAMIASFLSGAAMGLVTGLLHVKLKINGLLSGIITMTALLSINYLISGGPEIGFAQKETLLSNELLRSVNYTASNYIKVGLVLAIVIVVKLLLDAFFKTKTGFMLRATGDNPQMVTQMAKNTDNYKMLGLSLANGLVAFAGSLYVQSIKTYNTAMGPGTVVIALACVIVGCVIAKHIKKMNSTTGVIFGGIFYYAILFFANRFLGTDYTKLIVAALFVLVLLWDEGSLGKAFKRFTTKIKASFSKNKEGDKC